MNSSVRSRAEARYLLPLLRVARVVDGQLLEIRSRERLRGHLRFNSCTEGARIGPSCYLVGAPRNVIATVVGPASSDLHRKFQIYPSIALMPGKVLIQPADISPYIRHSINEDVEVKKIRTELGGKHFDL